MSKVFDGIEYSDDMTMVVGVESEDIISAVILEGVTEIEAYAFYGCESLKSVVIPEGVKEIGMGAFFGCKSLEFAMIPESVMYIGARAFGCCNSLENGNSLNEKYQRSERQEDCPSEESGVASVMSYLLESVENSSFEILSDSMSATVGLVKIAKNVGVFKLCAYSLEWIAKIQKVIEAFSDSSKSGADIFAVIQEQNLSLAEIPAKKAIDMTLKADSDGSLNLFAAGELRKMRYEGVKSIALFGITKIDERTFFLCTSLTSVKIPDGVTKIGDSAFNNCSLLTSVEIPSSVTEIGERAFFGCKSLEFVMIPESVMYIDARAFGCCNLLENGNSLNKEISNIKTLALQEAKDKKIAQVKKSGVASMLSSLFESVADSSFEILSNKMSATVVLMKIAKNTGVFKLGTDSAKWLPKIQKVIEAFSDSSKSGEDIFAMIQEHKLPLAEIPAKKAIDMTLKADSDGSLNLFAAGELRKMRYEGVKSIALFGITKIDWWAFVLFKSLVSVVIPSSVKVIGDSGFYGLKLLRLVEIPYSVTVIGRSAFSGCTSLSEITYGCTVAQWNAVYKASYWHNKVPATVVKCSDGDVKL